MFVFLFVLPLFNVPVHAVDSRLQTYLEEAAQCPANPEILLHDGGMASMRHDGLRPAK